MNIYGMDMAAANGTPVTQGHANYCAEHGHATWMDGGKDKGLCPRCGEVMEHTKAPAAQTGAKKMTEHTKTPKPMSLASMSPYGIERSIPWYRQAYFEDMSDHESDDTNSYDRYRNGL